MQTEINKDFQDRLKIVYKKPVYISLINETLYSPRLHSFTYHSCFDEIHLILLVDVEHLVPIVIIKGIFRIRWRVMQWGNHYGCFPCS